MRKREPAPDLAELEQSRMTQEIETEVIETQAEDLPPEEEKDIDPDNPDGEAVAEVTEQSSDAETDGLEITIEGFETEKDPEEAEVSAKPWVNELRKKHRDAQKRIRELEAQLNQGQKQEEAIVVGDKPTLAGCEFDDEKYEAQFLAWTERKAKYEAKQAEKRKAEEAVMAAWQERVKRYQTEKQSLPVSDYEQVEAVVAETLNNENFAFIVKAAPNAAEIIYALGKNEKALQHLAAKKDPVEFVWELRGLADKMKKTEPSKKSIPAPERIVSGGGGSSRPMTAENLEKLRDDLLRRGQPLTEYYRAKEKLKA